MSEPAWVPIGAALQDVGAEVAYQEFTTTVNITATTEGTAQQIVAAPSFMADGSSQYLVEFFCPYAQGPSGSGNGLYLVLAMDGASVGYFSGQLSTGATAAQQPQRLARRVTPAAGAHTFSVRGFASAASALIAGVGGAGAYVPGFIRITKVPSAVAGLAGLVPPTAIGTALPASPVDGQECVLTDSLTAPTYTWHLRYVAAKASNKWVFVGGSPMTMYTAPGGTILADSTWRVDPTLVLTIPRAGDYMIAVNAAYLAAALGGAQTDRAGLAYNNVATTIVHAADAFTGSGYDKSWAFENKTTGFAANDTVKPAYWSNAGGGTSLSLGYRGIQVTPVAVS